MADRNNAIDRRRRQRRPFTPLSAAIMPRDIDGHRLRNIPPNPPTKATDPAVVRKIRLKFGWACSFAAPISSNNFTYAQIAAQDALDYGTAGIRYQYMRIEKVEAWACVSSRTIASPLANGGPSRVVITDTASAIQQQYEDTPAPGVDWAVVGFKPDLQQRQSWVGTGSVTNVANLSLESSGLAAGDSFGGMLVVDFTCSLR